MAAYRIDPDASEVQVDARSSLHPIRGRATELSGDLEAEIVDGQPGPTLGGRIEVPIAALRSGNPLYDRELQRRVEARRFPTILGELREVAPLDGDGRFRVQGDLTFHGVTRTVMGELWVGVDDGALVIEGEQVFDVREFGITPPRILMLRVEPDVTVRIRLVARPV